MYWYVLARGPGPLERCMGGRGARCRRPQPESHGVGRVGMISAGVAGRVLKKVRRLVKPLHGPASVVGAPRGEMFMASRIHRRDSALIEPAFSRRMWISRSGRRAWRMCHIAKTATIDTDLVAQHEFAFFKPLHLDQVGTGRRHQRLDRGIEVAMLLLQARQLLAQRNFFVVVHRHRLFA